MPLPGIHPSVSRLSKKGRKGKKKIYLSARRNNQRKSGGKRGMSEGGKNLLCIQDGLPPGKEGKEWQNMHS